MADKLSVIRDRAEIMSVLLTKSTGYWSKIDKILKYPLIVTSSGLVIINSYFKDNDVDIKLPNVILNGINVLIMGILNNLALTQKIENLKAKAVEFLELSHEIEAELMLNNFTNDKIILIQEKYDIIMKYTLVEAVPESVKKSVRKMFSGKKTLPIILNGMMGLEEAQKNDTLTTHIV